MSSYQVAVLVGSLRRESLNRRLAQAAMRLAPPSLAFRVIELDALPMYNGDLEGQRPDAVNRFTEACAGVDGVFMVTPEYNRSLPAVLKNAIDWGSKPMERNVWRDKPAAITGTSPGAIGTAVAQQDLRKVLGVLGAHVMGGEAYISFKPELIDAQGEVTDASTRKFIADYMARFAGFVGKLAAPSV